MSLHARVGKLNLAIVAVMRLKKLCLKITSDICLLFVFVNMWFCHCMCPLLSPFFS